LAVNGQPVVDPTPGGSNGHIPYIHSDAQGSNRSDEANPNNRVIVPANFNEAHARAYADQIKRMIGSGSHSLRRHAQPDLAQEDGRRARGAARGQEMTKSEKQQHQTDNKWHVS
jgi:hypothetical protein